MIDDDDFIDIDELGDAPRDPMSRAGALVVPGQAVSPEAFAAEAYGFVAAPWRVLFVQWDDDGEETIINLDELRQAGFVGDTVAEAEMWLSPINEPPNPVRDAKILAARGDY